ncbi:MAG TPA: LytR C-terminal domain-containing protein [Gammaproteobacteria bacterium]
MRKTLIGLSAMLAFSPVHAVTMQAAGGGSGVGLMRTAELMDAGEFAFTLGETMAGYAATGAHPETLNTLTVPALSYGIGGWGEVHLTAPYLIASPEIGSKLDGMADPQLLFKFGLLHPDNPGGFSSALTLFSSITRGDEDAGVVSGDANFGGELNFSNRFDNGALHLNLGYEKTDLPVRSANPLRTEKYTAGVGIETALSSTTTLFAESTGYTEVDSDNHNLILTAGLQFTPSRNLGIQVGYGQGFPRDRSEPESLLLFGLTYSPNGSSKRRFASAGDMEGYRTLETRNAELSGRVVDLNAKVDDLENRLAVVESSAVQEEAASVPLTTAPRVEVINASRNPVLVQQVMDQLAQAGAQVVNIRKPANATEKRTWIRYREGFSDEAVELGHRIDGTQVVVRHPLPEGVDIQILIGDELGSL